MARLVFVNRYFHPDESATSRLLTRLAVHCAQSHDVTVLCSRQELERPRARLPARGRLGNVRIVRLPSTRFGRDGLAGRAIDYASFLASALVWLLLRLRRGDLLVAKTDPPLLGSFAAVAAYLRRARLVNWMQDVYPETAWRLGVGSARGLGRVLRAMRNAALRAAAVNVAISPGMARFLGDAARVPAPVVIPNWAEDIRPPDARTHPELRRSLGLEARFVIGYSGNLGRAHPLAPLLALASALRDDAHVHFLITGGGANFKRLREHVERAGTRNWTLLPYVPRDRLADLLATPDLHLTLLDPRLEQLIVPSKVYGILAAAKPLLHIGDPDGDIGQLVRGHACGWALPPGDPAAIVSCVRRLAQTPAELGTAGRNARRAFESQYSETMAMARWDAVVNGALAAITGPDRLARSRPN